MLTDDEALVARIVDGDERAFSALYRRYARTIAGVVYRLIGNDSDLDDIVQETFVDASLSLAALREPSKVRAWLVRIAVRRVHKRLRSRGRWRWLSTDVSELPLGGPDPNSAGKTEVDAVYQLLEKMSPKLRIPWVLHVLEGETLPEVASLCDASLATVKRRIKEADSRIQRGLHAK